MYPQLRINGGIADHSNLRITINGLPSIITNYIKEISYGFNMDGANLVHAGQYTSLSSTTGIYKGTASATILKEGWDLLLTLLPSGYTHIRANWNIAYYKAATGEAVQDILERVRITGAEKSSSSGGKEIDVKLTLLVEGTIFESGKSAIGIDQDLAVQF